MDDPLGLRTPQRPERISAVEPAAEEIDPQDLAIERMWPLDLSLAVLGGLVIYTIATRLPVGDERWYYNPWLYAAIVPLGVVGSSLVLRNIASKFFRKSLQFGFLLSVMVHLVLTIAAFNWMIFAPMWSSSATGTKPMRAPVRKTVPDYLFTRNDMPQKQPDWSRPVDAATTSRTVTPTNTDLPPIDISAERLEMPSEQPRIESTERVFLKARAVPEIAAPTPSSSAGKLSRQSLLIAPSVDSEVPVPKLLQPVAAEISALEREASESRSAASSRRMSELNLPAPAALPMPQIASSATAPAPRIERRSDSGVPQMGSFAEEFELRSRRRPEANALPAGAIPTTPTISVARSSDQADRMLSDRVTPLAESRRSTGAELRPTPSDNLGSIVPDREALLDAPRARRDLAASGLPTISEGAPAVANDRQGRAQRFLELPVGALAGPDASAISASINRESKKDGSLEGLANSLDRSKQVGEGAVGKGAASSDAKGVNPKLMTSPAAATVDLSVPLGPAGLSVDPSRRIGFALAEEMPEIASIDFGAPAERPREFGGPPPPAGSKVTGVRPFDRRKLRTAGGAALTPDGTLGAKTEEAIERGLAYLAERQNANGSWSLQGHGEPTQMRSDTAATGLCLLAFQGAGYTHLEHQYAETVARGLQFLVNIQRSNGDLFRPEDAVSNRNAWLYSHGIAALAMCEAWGMTRDPNLRDPAQRSIDFIAASQDRLQGGWRYQPGVSSDTSVTGWMVMALKSAELSGLRVPAKTYDGIERWMDFAQEPGVDGARYRYNPDAPDTDAQRHGRRVTPTMTAVGLLARLYMGWERTKLEMQQGADYLAKFPPAVGSPRNPKRDTYYWYYATQVMFHMGGKHWEEWNGRLNPILTSSQVRGGPNAGSWEPMLPVPDRWAPFAGRIYVTSMNLLSLEVYYRHLPIYEETAK